jgi:hypothetical protein
MLPGNANKPPEPPPPEAARLCLPFARFAGLPSGDAGLDVVTAPPDTKSSAEEKGFGERRSFWFPAAGAAAKKTLPEASSPFAAAAASAAVAARTAGARDGLSAATRARALARAKRRVAPRPAAKPTVSSSLKEKASDDTVGRHDRRHGDVGGASFAPSKRRSDPLAASLSSPCHGPSGASALFNALRRKRSGEDETFVLS